MRRSLYFFSGYMVSAWVVLLDYFSKTWALRTLHPYEAKSVCALMNWTLAFNTGSAFSFLDQAGPWHQWLLGGFSALMSVFIAVWMARGLLRKIEFYSLSLILGGALGNLMDRIHYGYVIDFIDVFYRDYHWPVFNIADSAICLGAGFLIFDRIFENRRLKLQ